MAFFNSLNKKLKKSYSVINPEVGKMVFPNGEPEYIYVGTMLNTLLSNRDVFDMMKIYVSVYVYYQSTMGNTAKTYLYAKKKAEGTLLDGEIKNIIALAMFNITASKADVSDPVAAIRQYRGFVDSYLNTVESIKKYQWRFETKPVNAGTVDSPILVDGVCGVRDYISSISIPSVEKITYERTSVLHLTNEDCGVNYAIDEYTLYNAKNSSEIAKLWFNIYGTENTDVQPACFSGKEPFSASKVAPELFKASIDEWQAITQICQSAKISYDANALALSTFSYFYQVWTLIFKNLRLGQSKELEEAYISYFVDFNKKVFANASYRQVIENEKIFPEKIQKVFYRIRTSYENNNFVFSDDGLSDEFILEFLADSNDVQKIKPMISEKIMKDWVALGNDANERYLT